MSKQATIERLRRQLRKRFPIAMIEFEKRQPESPHRPGRHATPKQLDCISRQCTGGVHVIPGADITKTTPDFPFYARQSDQ